jgi:7-cyano-7-deazaguanine synthase
VAYAKGIPNIAVGLLAERTAIFPDQSDQFLNIAEEALKASLGAKIGIHAPLRDFTKKDVVEIAYQRKIANFYSCHAGTEVPCGKCIACLEYI